jgi:hypothetical protein
MPDLVTSRLSSVENILLSTLEFLPFRRDINPPVQCSVQKLVFTALCYENKTE